MKSRPPVDDGDQKLLLLCHTFVRSDVIAVLILHTQFKRYNKFYWPLAFNAIFASQLKCNKFSSFAIHSRWRGVPPEIKVHQNSKHSRVL